MIVYARRIMVFRLHPLPCAMSRQLCTIHRLTPFSVAIGLPWPVERILPKQVRWKDHVRMKFWAWDEKELPSITHAIRTAVATTVSLIIARLVQMPEAYWAAIATPGHNAITLGATLTLSVERIVATAVGASAGALNANFSAQTWLRSRTRSFSSDCSRS